MVSCIDDCKVLRMWSLKFLLVCVVCLPQVASNETMQLRPASPMIVNLAERNTIAMAIGDMLNLAFVANEHRRVFNFYAYIERHPTPARRGFFGEIIDETMRRTGHLTGDAITVRVGYGEPVPGDNERHYSVLLVDSAAALKLLYRQLLDDHLHISGFYIVVLYTFDAYYYDELIKIFELNGIVGIIHANVLIYALTGRLLVFAGFPYNRFHCAGATPVISNQFDGVQWQRPVKNFFMEKLNDLHGCTLMCASWMDMPYLQLERYGPKKRDIKLLGIEGKLLEYLAAKMNFTLKFHWMSDAEILQTLEREGAVFDKLFGYGIDFAIGAFHYRPVSSSDPYTPTNPYYLSYYNFVTSARTQPYPAFVKLLFPFSYGTWSALALYMLAGCIFCTITSFSLSSRQREFLLGARNHSPLYNMFVISVGGAVSKFPRRNFSRYLLLQWLLATLVLRNAYQGFMYHYIRTDINIPPPSTIGDLIEQNYTFFMTNATFQAIRNLRILSSMAKVINETNFDAFDWMRVNGSNYGDRTAILSAYEYYGFYRRKRKSIYSELYVLPDKVFTQQLAIYMRKNSVLLARFNRYIIEFVNAGLMSKWERVFLEDYKPWTAARPSSEESAQPQVMQLKTLEGAFRVLIAGGCAGCAVLVLEWLIHGICVCVQCICGFGN